jgi:hypothetical protein
VIRRSTRSRASRFHLALVLACLAPFFAACERRGVLVTASASFHGRFPAESVIDGDPDTEWLLPGGERGWVQLEFQTPQRIDKVRLLNGHNGLWNDRATEKYLLELRAADGPRRSIAGRFERLEPRPEWVEHEIGIEDVERIRLRVISYHGYGGGLAEIFWEDGWRWYVYSFGYEQVLMSMYAAMALSILIAYRYPRDRSAEG